MKLLKNSIEIKTRTCRNNLEKIEEIIMIQIKVTVKYENFINLVFSQMWSKESQNIKCRNCVLHYIKILEYIVKDGIDAGEFYDGNAGALASGVFEVTCSSLIYRMKDSNVVDVDKIYYGFIDTVVRGISKK